MPIIKIINNENKLDLKFCGIKILSYKKGLQEERILLGRHSYAEPGFKKFHPDTTVGAFCSIAYNVCLGPSQHPLHLLSTSTFQYMPERGLKGQTHFLDFEKYSKYQPCHIGNDVWIGANVVVMDGITIGDGAIVGANAVVTKDVPPYAVVVGVPAKIIKYRFSPEIIEKLLQLKWWELDDEIISGLPFDNIEKCIEILEQIRRK